MKPHPNLSDEINLNLLQSEKDGGVYVDKVAPGTGLRVQTRNTIYAFRRMADGSWMVEGNERYCPNPTQVNIHGSTWGGSMLKVGFIGVGMLMELGLIVDGRAKVIHTSLVKSIAVTP